MLGSRKVCETCNQELSHAASYRHLHDENAYVCPCKRQRDEIREDPVSTFDFGSDQSESGEGERQFPSNCDEYQSDISTPEDLTMSDIDSEHSAAVSEQEFSDCEEIWEASED